MFLLAAAAAASAEDISWSHLSSTLGARTLLHESSGSARAGRLLGVLGPSGAGKTTLLHSVVGACPAHRRLRLRGRRSGPRFEDGTVALLTQDDAQFGMLTVREVLTASAALQCADEGAAARAARVERLLKSLGLWAVRDSRVGDRSHRGISGGERRRLSVGEQLLGEPKALLADEPTTGLDAHQAERVVRLIRALSREREIPAVATLHQPRSTIWRHLDDALLLAPGGRVIYHGPADAALHYFARLGHKCPPQTNPAEFLIDLVSICEDDEAERAADLARVAALADAHAAAAAALPPLPPPPPPLSAPSPRRRLAPLRRCALCLRRAWRQNIRDGWVNGVRLAVSGGLALVFGEVFGRLSTPSAASVAERIALLSYASINMAMLALMKTIDMLGRERPVVGRERARNLYGAAEYLVAKLIAEVPLDAAFAAGFGCALKARLGLAMPTATLVATLSLTAAASAALGLALGALVPGQDAPLAVGLPVMIVHMVLGILNPAGAADAKPPSAAMSVVSHASPIKWSVRALCCAELRGLELAPSSLASVPRMGGLALVRSGDEVLERLGLAQSTAGASLHHLALVTAAECAVALVGMAVTTPRFERLS